MASFMGNYDFSLANHKRKIWSAIAVTAASAEQARAYRQELLLRQKRGVIPEETILLAVPDPSSARVGSGGATLNALVAVAEYLSAQAGRSFIDPEVISSSHILILHSGGDSQRIPSCSVCGKAFSTLPALGEDGELLTPLDLLLDALSRVCASSPPGFFAASGDVMLLIPEDDLDWSRPGATGLAIPADLSYGPKHGVYKLKDGSSQVEAFFQKEPEETLRQAGAVRPGGSVLVDSGVVYFCGETTKTLLNLHVAPPLDACTYLGVDNGAVPLRFELYSDILLCMAQNAERETYIGDPASPALRRARELLWNSLHTVPFHAAVSQAGVFAHLGTTREYVDMFVADSPLREHYHLTEKVQSYIEPPATADGAALVNSLLAGSGSVQKNAVIEHSELRGGWNIGESAFVSGLRPRSDLIVLDNIAVQEIQLLPGAEDNERHVIAVIGVDDSVKCPIQNHQATYLNKPWSDFLQRTGLALEEIWPCVEPEKRTLWNARLFPMIAPGDSGETVLWLQHPASPSGEMLRRWRNAERLSFADIQRLANPEAEFLWRRKLTHKMDRLRMGIVLSERRDECLLPIFARCARENHLDALHALDGALSSAPFDAAARTLSSIADLLAAFAGNRAGLRSGPARNVAWKQGFRLLEQGAMAEAAAVLAEERKHWLGSPEFLMRAARHYEGAAQVLIRKTVETASIQQTPCPPAVIGEWSIAEIPARVDLAGGWSDTPPITFEHGGAVVNAAVKVDGEKPIGAKVRRLDEPIVKIMQDDFDAPLLCRSLSDLSTYAQPLAPGALVKAAILCAGIVSLSSSQPLSEQLQQRGGGLEIHTWSRLPTGSGLGTSSILAAALFAALGKTIGFRYDNESLVHAVLRLEQMLTTGGGWQDQAGGLYPGVKITRSSASIPLHVESKPIPLSDDFRRTLNAHWMLIYTGRTRLARNLLQDVIRRWYARIPEMVRVVDDLVRNAEAMRQALAASDLEAVGSALDNYWEQKKRIAGGVEPANVAEMLAMLRPHIYGAALTGAGGGGFMILIAKEPRTKDKMRDILHPLKDSRSLTYHDIELDGEGLVIA
ncbi:MAG: L-fucokinase [Candidatus Omnitrophota bacterium]